jgi:hypothetical protein
MTPCNYLPPVIVQRGSGCKSEAFFVDEMTGFSPRLLQLGNKTAPKPAFF